MYSRIITDLPPKANPTSLLRSWGGDHFAQSDCIPGYIIACNKSNITYLREQRPITVLNNIYVCT